MNGHMLVHPGRGDPGEEKGGRLLLTLNGASLDEEDASFACKGFFLKSLENSQRHFCRLASTLVQWLRPEIWTADTEPSLVPIKTF